MFRAVNIKHLLGMDLYFCFLLRRTRCSYRYVGMKHRVLRDLCVELINQFWIE